MKICYYPAVSNAKDLAALQSHYQWFVRPFGHQAQVLAADERLNSEAIAHQGLTLQFNDNFPRGFHGVDMFLCWHAPSRYAAPAFIRRKSIGIDPFIDNCGNDLLLSKLSETYNSYSRSGQAIIRELNKDFACKDRKVMLIGSGPTDPEKLKSYLATQGQHAFIYIGTSIFDDDLSSEFPPDFIISNDGPSQFSNCATARRYVRRLSILAERNADLQIFIPHIYAAIIHAHWPEHLAHRVIFIPLDPRSRSLSHTLLEHWKVSPSSNVLTSIGLPLACSLSDHVAFAGISLKMPSRSDPAEIHWDHNRKTFYARHVSDMISAFPGSAIVDPNYVKSHIERLQTVLAKYAARGITFADISGSRLDFEPGLTTSSGHLQDFGQPAFKVIFFNGLTVIDNRPIEASLLLAAIAVLFQFLLEGFFDMTLGNLLFGTCIFLICMVHITLRLRMNRKVAEAERRISQQQAVEFENLSVRLKAIESRNE